MFSGGVPPHKDKRNIPKIYQCASAFSFRGGVSEKIKRTGCRPVSGTEDPGAQCKGMHAERISGRKGADDAAAARAGAGRMEGTVPEIVKNLTGITFHGSETVSVFTAMEAGTNLTLHNDFESCILDCV